MHSAHASRESDLNNEAAVCCGQVSPKLLRLALAWELPAKVHGGLSRRTQQRLDQLANVPMVTREAKPGMRLVRGWSGVLHVVQIGEDGVIRWNEREWKSLSEVARAITGTRWSGPAFFGLKTRRNPRATIAGNHARCQTSCRNENEDGRVEAKVETIAQLAVR